MTTRARYLARRLFAVCAIVVGCSESAKKEPQREDRAATAALTGTTFEIDFGTGGATDLKANFVVDGGAGAKDWTNAPNLRMGIDLPSGTGDNSLGSGTKEDDVTPVITTGSIPNNKDDLSRLLVANESVGGKDFLYLGYTRENTGGTANQIFEFNQLRPTAGNTLPARSAGDILIAFDYGGGGTRVLLGLHRWLTSGSSAKGECEAATSFPCWSKRVNLNGASGVSYAEGSVNDTNEPYYACSIPTAGGVTDSFGCNTNIGDKHFGEAVINLTDSGVFPANTCRSFGSAWLRSRSSTSFTSASKDFIAPINVDINNCQPAKVRVLKVDSADSTRRLAGAVFQLFRDDGDGVLDSGDTQVGSNCTTPDSTAVPPAEHGVCEFTVSLDGNYILHELTPPPGYAGSADQLFTVTITATEQTITKTFTNTVVNGRIDINKADDRGNALAGATFAYYRDASVTDPVGVPKIGDAAIDSATDDLPSLGTCVTGSDGKCSFTNVPPGAYWIVEITPPSGYFLANPRYKHAVVPIGSMPDQGGTATVNFGNPRKFHTVVLVCQTSNNALYPSSVALDGLTAQTSISAAQATALGLDASKLCLITQGQFGEKTVGNNTGTYGVNIPTGP